MTKWKHDEINIFKAGNINPKEFSKKAEDLFKEIELKKPKRSEVLEMIENTLDKREMLMLYDIANLILNGIREVLNEGLYSSSFSDESVEKSYS